MATTDPVMRAFKEMGGKHVITMKRSADGLKVTADYGNPGDISDFSFPFIWWADPELIYWNGTDLVIHLDDGPGDSGGWIMYHAYAFEMEEQVYTMERVW